MESYNTVNEDVCTVMKLSTLNKKGHDEHATGVNTERVICGQIDRTNGRMCTCISGALLRSEYCIEL